jgi:large subunit ribosomal protein L10
MKVVKNNILRRAAQSLGHEGVVEHLVGPSAMITSKDEVSALKITYDFLKEHEKLSVKVGIVDKKVTSEAELKALSQLPNKEGMLSMLLSVLQAPIRNLACVVKAVSEKEN